jgi:hypothetical protein
MFDTQLARQKLGKHNTPRAWRLPSAYGCHGAPPLAPLHTTISQHDARQVNVVKLEDRIVFTIYGPEGRSLYCLNLNCRAPPGRFFRLDLSFR